MLAVPVASSAPASARAKSVTALNNQILREVNHVRVQNHLQPLVASSQLAGAAAEHSRSMASAGFFTHESADGSAFWKRIQRYYSASGFHFWAVGENLVWTSPDLTAKQAVEMWMKSPPHRANLLSKRWHQVGLAAVHSASAPGTYENRAVTIVTADFGVRR
ncbi:MAG: CAP domain-containing protein [Gaiellaceae bacterium]